MYYLELIERFWDFNKTAKISPTEILLYFCLLKTGYENDRYDFKISDVELGRKLGLTRKTIKSTKEKLKNLGLVQFQSKNGLLSHYRLVLNYSFKIEPDISIKKEESTNVEEPLNPKTSIISTETIPSIQNALEIITKVEINSDVKASSESSQKQKLELEQQNLKNSKIPSLDEFIEYAKSLEGYEPELELSISEKYESWKNNGWKNTSNRPISNWKSTLKSTLPYLKNTNGENSLSLQDIPNIKRPES